MKKRIYIQMTAIAAMASLATMLLVAFVCYELFCGQILEDLRTDAYLLKEAENREDILQSDLVASGGLLRVTWVDGQGEVIFENSADAAEMNNHSGRPEILQALEEGEGEAVRRSHTVQKSSFYYAVRLEDGSVIRVAREADSIWSIFAGILPAVFLILAILLVLCMVIARFLTKNLLAPIERIAQNVEHPLEEAYEELVPFVETIRKQHEDILKNAGMRQEFTANVSHELKTPLAAISGYSELIENGMAAGEDIVRFAGEIHRNSNRLLTLIDDVIRLSELDASEREEEFAMIDLREIADTCVNMLQVHAEKHGVELAFEGERCIVCSERRMMEELVYNLCDNAIRYNREGGRVRVETKTEKGCPVLCVEDTGIGIGKEHQERIFERFYRVDKSRSKSTGGTGLGLAIVKHIVAKNHAGLKLESEWGEGTRITVVFGGQSPCKGPDG